jgi:hypothetical protein
MQEFEYIVVTFNSPGEPPLNWGVLLLDAVSERLHYRFRTDFPAQVVERGDAEIMKGMADHLIRVAEESGAAALLNWLLDTASNTVQVTDRLRVSARNADEALKRLVREHLHDTPSD